LTCSWSRSSLNPSRRSEGRMTVSCKREITFEDRCTPEITWLIHSRCVNRSSPTWTARSETFPHIACTRREDKCRTNVHSQSRVDHAKGYRRICTMPALACRMNAITLAHRQWSLSEQ
jgi:hypothetical protein